MNDVDSKVSEIPDYVIISIARLILPEIQAFYNSDEGKQFLDEMAQREKQRSSLTA